MERVGGPVRAKKADVPKWGGLPLTPPTCNIAWVACMRRLVRAQNRLFFSLDDQAHGSHLPNSILHRGVRGRQVATQSRRLFFSLAPESVFFL